jgi:hypothetical protein
MKNSGNRRLSSKAPVCRECIILRVFRATSVYLFNVIERVAVKLPARIV